MINTSVIIPNWNGCDLLRDCLTSLSKQTYKNFEIILIDNGSSDNSIDYVRENFPKVRIKILDKNYGFAKAINKGVSLSKSKYVVFLNNDTEVDQNFVNSLIKCVIAHPEVISVNSKILNFKNREIIDGVGILINEVGQAESIGYLQKDMGQYNKESYIFGATGGASLFKREEFVKIGGFDEDYFMYSEEVDFAFRAQFLGYKSIYSPKAIIYHKHKATAKKFPQYIEYWQFKNMTQTIVKDFPTEILVKNWRWLKIVLVHFNTIFYQIRNGYFWPPLVTEAWLIFHLFSLLKKRAIVQKSRKVSIDYIDGFLQDKKITFWGLKS